MKIFNFGNDYAYQQKQKQQAKENPEVTKNIDNVANQIPTGGEGETDTAPETTKTPKSRKKKENREETKEGNQDNSEVL